MVSAVALMLVVRFVAAPPLVATESALGELRAFAVREVQVAIALTALGNVGVVMVFNYIAPLLTGVSGFAAGAIPALLLLYGAGAVLGTSSAGCWPTGS